MQWYICYWANYVWIRGQGLSRQEWVDRVDSFSGSEDPQGTVQELIRDKKPLMMAVMGNGLAASFNSRNLRKKAATVLIESLIKESAELKKVMGNGYYAEACHLRNKAVEVLLEPSEDGSVLSAAEVEQILNKLVKFRKKAFTSR